ncbi:hypothetical protein ACFRK5_22050 [Streptomyces niveus]|uniref:hypothetical protein n=1 Tax=Streptomyces niveus TaxID=193462 RepID=UPI0036B87CA4
MLNDTTMAPFVAQARRYVGRYRGRQAVLTHLDLGETSGVDFAPEDRVLHFVNGYDEDLIFWNPGERAGDAVNAVPTTGIRIW